MSKHPNQIPDGVRRDIIARYNQGESAQSIATNLQLSKGSIYNVLRSSGLKTKRTMHSLSEGQEREILQRYSRGESVISISEDFLVNHQTIYNMLDRRGVKRAATNIRIDSAKRRAIVDACRNGASGTIPRVAKQFGVSTEVVGKFLRLANVNVGTGTPATHSVNDNAFDELTEEALYWVGFIFADGHINHREGGQAPRLIIGLSEKDEEHLNKLRTFLEASNPIRKYIDPRKQGRAYVYLSVRSRRICDRLTEFGIVKKRTRTPISTVSQSRHFWRGAFDGDGWLSVGRHKSRDGNVEYFYPHIGLSGQQPLLNAFQQFSRENGLTLLSLVKCEGEVWKVSTSGSTAKAIIELLYGTCSIVLKRKQERVTRILSARALDAVSEPYEEGPSVINAKMDEEEIDEE